MSRTPEVDDALHASELLRPFAREWLSPNNQYLLTLAAEVERLEARLRELQAGDYEKLEAQNAKLWVALTDCSHMLWNVLHNGMLVPAARRSQLEQMEATIKRVMADAKGAA